MYYFIFDAPAGPNDLQKITKLKEILGELGIAGEMASPMPGRDVVALVENAISKRYSTIVAVGDTELVQAAAHAVAPHNVVFGIIPLHENSELFSLIGVKTREEACEILKKRRYHSVYFGAAESSIGEVSFLSTASAQLPNSTLTLTTQDSRLSISNPGTLSITPASAALAEEATFIVRLRQSHSPKKQSLLRRIIGSSSPSEHFTQFSCSTLSIEGVENTILSAAGSKIAVLPCKIKTSSEPLKLIAKPVS